MARRDEQRPTKSKVIVMLFQVEGDDQTIQEGFKTIGQAMGNVFRPVRPDYTPALPSGAPKGEPKQVSPAEPRESTGELFPEENEAATPATPSRTKGPKAIKALEVLPLDLELGGDSLEKFCSEKGIDGNSPHSHRYLAVAVWLKTRLKIAEIGDNHAHTCYRRFGWHTPNDPTSPLRAMKKQSWFNKGEETGTYTINHIGENELNKLHK